MSTQPEKFIVYTDGASRGNPGPASIGIVVQNARGTVLKTYGETIGKATNNEAEYTAVMSALKKIKQLFGKARMKSSYIEMRMDSQLVASQLSGHYKLENEKLYAPFIAIWNLKMDFGEVRFIYVPREENMEADRLANEALDQKEQGTLL